jgi:hypothetical protein
MRTVTKPAALFCAAIAVAFFSIASSAADSAKEMTALRAADQTWVKAYNAGDADGLANLYDENAVLLPPGSPAVNGRAAIKAFWANDTAESQKAGAASVWAPIPRAASRATWVGSRAPIR